MESCNWDAGDYHATDPAPHDLLHDLVLDNVSLLLDASVAGGGIGLGELLVLLGAVHALLKDGLGLVELELGLEVLRGAAVGMAAGVVEVERLIGHFITDVAPVGDEMTSVHCLPVKMMGEDDLPVGLAAAILLCFLGVGVGKAVLAKELGDVLLWHDGAISNAGVVLVVVLVGAGHCNGGSAGA